MTRSTRLLAVTIAALTFMLVAWAGAAQAHRGTVVGPGDSIQAAVDAAHPGDIIRVFGEHRENVVIQKDGLTLRGAGATIRPPATPAADACFDPTCPGSGQGHLRERRRRLRHGRGLARGLDVTVSGFTVRDFTGAGIGAVAARDTTLKGNIARDNGERDRRDRVDRHPDAVQPRIRRRRRRLLGGAVADGRRDAVRQRSAGQPVRHPHQRRRARQDRRQLGPRQLRRSPRRRCARRGGRLPDRSQPLRRNTRACPANVDFPAVSGAGVALFGATGNTVVGNLITGNVPTGETRSAAGGVAVIEGGTPPTGNVVKGNRDFRQRPRPLLGPDGHRERLPRQPLPHQYAAESLPLSEAPLGARDRRGPGRAGAFDAGPRHPLRSRRDSHGSSAPAGRRAARPCSRVTASVSLVKSETPAPDEQRARGGAGATPTSLLHPCKAAVTARLSPSMEAGLKIAWRSSFLNGGRRRPRTLLRKGGAWHSVRGDGLSLWALARRRPRTRGVGPSRRCGAHWSRARA